MKTDKELFEKLLEHCECDFDVYGNDIEIGIDGMITHGGVSISFNSDGSFKGFECCE